MDVSDNKLGQFGLQNATCYKIVKSDDIVADAKIRGQKDLTVQYQIVSMMNNNTKMP